MMKPFLSLPRRAKQVISVGVDLVLLLLAFWSALTLRVVMLTPIVTPTVGR